MLLIARGAHPRRSGGPRGLWPLPPRSGQSGPGPPHGPRAVGPRPHCQRAPHNWRSKALRVPFDAIASLLATPLRSSLAPSLARKRCRTWCGSCHSPSGHSLGFKVQRHRSSTHRASDDAGAGAVQELHDQAPSHFLVDPGLLAPLGEDLIKEEVMQASVLGHRQNLEWKRKHSNYKDLLRSFKCCR